MIKEDKQKILLDADVIIHFVKGEQILLLPKIFKEQKIILDIVCKELMKNRKYSIFYINLVNYGIIQEIRLINDIKVLKEYAVLKKKFGDGESACMAYCKFHKDILASSNLKDITDYCNSNGIKYLTTMDFLVEAYRTKLLTEAECDYFIYNVTSQDSKLPCNTIKEYIELKKK